MKKFFLLLVAGFFAFISSGINSSANAQSISDTCGIGGGYEGHCGIWLCLPGGFPSDCGLQKSVFKSRLRKTIRGSCHSPLPRWSACSQEGTGTAEIGRGYPPCRAGYSLRREEDDRGRTQSARCVNTSSSCVRHSRDGADHSGCGNYSVQEQYYVDMEVNGTRYPRSYFGLN